jgi:hypothetical protein
VLLQPAPAREDAAAAKRYRQWYEDIKRELGETARLMQVRSIAMRTSGGLWNAGRILLENLLRDSCRLLSRACIPANLFQDRDAETEAQQASLRASINELREELATAHLQLKNGERAREATELARKVSLEVLAVVPTH